MSNLTPFNEHKTSKLARPPMADHTLRAMAGAYVRFLMQRTGKSAKEIGNHFYCDKGLHAERAPAEFRRWAGERVFVMEQLGQNPFEVLEEAW